jgi:hypothetical protein
MVEDDKIKTTVSPFAIREGEIKTFDGKDGYVSINQIIHKINLGHISDIHFEILNLVNEFEFMTSRQIYFMLLARGVEIKSQDKLNTKLDQMVRTKILTRYYFTSEEGKGIYRVYCLEKMGKYLLNSREQECKWQPTDNTKPVHLIKKRLAGNQVIVAYIRKSSNFKSYQVKPNITAKRAGKSFKAHGSVTLGNSGKTVDLLFECVRRESGWQERFVERMRLYKDFYENFVPGDSGFLQYAPQLILVCEDDNHMVEVLREIIANELTINKVKIYFTTDLSQNSNKLDGSLTEFVIDEATGKYKKNNIVFKGLA